MKKKTKSSVAVMAAVLIISIYLGNKTGVYGSFNTAVDFMAIFVCWSHFNWVE